jgi:hypothetical protein
MEEYIAGRFNKIIIRGIIHQSQARGRRQRIKRRRTSFFELFHSFSQLYIDITTTFFQTTPLENNRKHGFRTK